MSTTFTQQGGAETIYLGWYGKCEEATGTTEALTFNLATSQFSDSTKLTWTNGDDFRDQLIRVYWVNSNNQNQKVFDQAEFEEFDALGLGSLWTPGFTTLYPGNMYRFIFKTGTATCTLGEFVEGKVGGDDTTYRLVHECCTSDDRVLTTPFVPGTMAQQAGAETIYTGWYGVCEEDLPLDETDASRQAMEINLVSEQYSNGKSVVWSDGNGLRTHLLKIYWVNSNNQNQKVFDQGEFEEFDALGLGSLWTPGFTTLYPGNCYRFIFKDGATNTIDIPEFYHVKLGDNDTEMRLNLGGCCPTTTTTTTTTNTATTTTTTTTTNTATTTTTTITSTTTTTGTTTSTTSTTTTYNNGIPTTTTTMP